MNFIYFFKIIFYIMLSLFSGELLLIFMSGIFKEYIFLIIIFIAFIFILLGFFLTFCKKSLSKLFFMSSLSVGFFYFVVVIFSHGEGGYSNHAAWVLAHSYVSKSANSINVFKKKNSHCPAHLRELTGYPLEFLDPFNAKNKLLKYYVLEDECIIYSIGLDRVDNKGMVAIGDRALEHDWDSSHMSYSLIAFIYKPVFDETKTLGDIVEKVK